MLLKHGDMVKIELGAHIDGFPAMVGHTLVVGATQQAPVTGKKADIMQAAYLAMEASVRLLRPGNTNFDVTDMVMKLVKEEFECLPVEGMLSSKLERTVLDGEKQIVMNPTVQQRREFETSEFELGEVWSIDVLVSSSSDARARLSPLRTSIYKRMSGEMYSLKMQTSRKVMTEISQKFGYMPFNVASMQDEKKARVGLTECVKHQLVLPYDIMEEREGEFVAQFLTTVLLMPNGNIIKLTQTPWDQQLVQSDKTVKDEQLKALIARSLKAPKKKT